MADNRRRLVLASGNPGKLRELRTLLLPLGWKVRSQGEWDFQAAAEDGLTFVENALIKARHAAAHTGLPALGDDSGLVVDALHGAPGIHSARYAGAGADDTANNRKLLAELVGVPRTQRAAHFYCAMVFLRDRQDPAPLVATGVWHGHILDAPVGDGGFGYDPLFWVESQQCTSAELAAEVKNRLSHRGQAMTSLLQQLRKVQLAD